MIPIVTGLDLFFHCLIDSGTDDNTSSGVKNEGIDCWNGCGRRQGECAWCGDGMCCRLGWKGNGCDGKMGQAGKGHVCTGKSETDTGKHRLHQLFLMIPISIIFSWYCNTL